eukprot:10396138-Ditylum_brightwellii.AAC.1
MSCESDHAQEDNEDKENEAIISRSNASHHLSLESDPSVMSDRGKSDRDINSLCSSSSWDVDAKEAILTLHDVHRD